MLLEDAADVLTDHALEVVGGCSRGRERRRHLTVLVEEPDKVRLAQHAGAFEQIEELPDVARKIVVE